MQYSRFFCVFVLDKIGQENMFHDILERKKRLPTLQKEKIKQVEKIGIFPKRLVHEFDQKLAIFPYFFFSQKITRKCV